jgi:hypothetical protein
MCEPIHYRSATIAIGADGLVRFDCDVERTEAHVVTVTGQAFSVPQAKWFVDQALAGK